VKVYIAGPMQGIPNFNYPLFNEVANEFRMLGHEVFNPAEKDTQAHGYDIPADNSAACNKFATDEHGFSLRRALRDDLCWIAENADGIVLLPGWEYSKGAGAEWALAKALQIKFYYWQTDVNDFND